MCVDTFCEIGFNKQPVWYGSRGSLHEGYIHSLIKKSSQSDCMNLICIHKLVVQWLRNKQLIIDESLRDQIDFLSIFMSYLVLSSWSGDNYSLLKWTIEHLAWVYVSYNFTYGCAMSYFTVQLITFDQWIFNCWVG